MIPAPDQCHHHWLFIASERGQAERKTAYVCASCGTFRVYINGAELRFTLPLDSQVAAAGRYAARLRESEGNECQKR